MIKMFKRAFTDWKKEYAIFWLMVSIFVGCVLLVDSYYEGVSLGDLFTLLLVVGIFHIIFFGIQYGYENDERRRLENHTLNLEEFTKEYDLTKEEAFYLLQEGKLDGFIAFKTYPIRDKSKEEIQALVNKGPK